VRQPARLHLAEQIVDRLVARRRDAHALAALEQVDDQPPRRPRLPGARRTLDEEVPPSTRSTSAFISSSVETWTRAPPSGGSRRSTPRESRVAVAASGQAEQRAPAASRCCTARRGSGRAGAAAPSVFDPRAQGDPPGHVVELDDRAGALSVNGSVTPSPGSRRAAAPGT
jgi:hypothetical protein